MGKDDHSGQGLVERHIGMVQNTFYRLNESVKRGDNAIVRLSYSTFDKLASLANSAKNESLEYG
eukprot:15797238-Heterocapsa_arctica.AAC.1